MTLLFAAAALAMPEGLAEAVPSAQDTLEACVASSPCERWPAARAAWLLAVHRYIDTGHADGSLAATVRELDEDLFDDLPPILQAAASEPPVWAVDLTVVTPPAPASDLPPLAAAAADGALRAGLFRDAGELLANTPSGAWLDHPIKTKKDHVMIGEQVDVFAIDVDKPTRRGLGKMSAFSDGTDVYVIASLEPRKANRDFAKLTFVGPYGYFETIGVATTTNAQGATTTWTYKERHLLDLRTAERVHFGKRTLRAMLADDPALLAAFEDEPNKGRTLLAYLERYYAARP